MAEIDPQPTPKPRKRRAATKSVDPIELALARSGAGSEDAAAALILKQRRLVEEQIEDLRLKKFTRFLVIGLVLLILAGIAVAAVKASRSNALIVEPLRVPPALAQRGLTGEVLAARLLDRLAAMQALSESVRSDNSFSNNWEDDLKVAVPQTGVSLGELWRLMRDWLGNDTRISGEVVTTPQGLAVTARTEGSPGETFAGGEGELDQLIQRAAEAIYRNTQPYRYAGYANSLGRAAEDEAILLRLSADRSPVEQKWAFNGLGVNRREQGRYREAVGLADRALAIDPLMLAAWANRSAALYLLGDLEGAVQSSRRVMEIFERERLDELDRIRAERLAERDRWRLAEWLGDYFGWARMRLQESRSLDERERSAAYGDLGRAFAQLHEPRRAMRLIARITASGGPPPLARDFVLATRSEVALRAALEAHDTRGAEAALRLLLASVDRTIAVEDAGRPSRLEGQRRLIFPFAAIAMARMGHPGAREMAARAPLDCYDCVRARGVAAAAAGDRREAERWFREAVRQGPSIPFAYDDWGRMLLLSGDAAGAIALFEQAHRAGPRWADPLKHWGDARARQGRDRDAVRLYAQAAERAPRWGALHINWGQALWRQGRHEEARERFRAASRIDLTPRDRARLRRLWPIAFPQRSAPIV